MRMRTDASRQISGCALTHLANRVGKAGPHAARIKLGWLAGCDAWTDSSIVRIACLVANSRLSPDAVSVSPVGLRKNSGTPTASSSSRTVRDNAEALMLSANAAR